MFTHNLSKNVNILLYVKHYCILYFFSFLNFSHHAGISVIFKGKAKTKWREVEHYGNNQTHSIPYYLKEKLFDEKIMILGKGKYIVNVFV